MRVRVDGRKSLDKEMLHNHLKAVFDFPEYYGKNLDALYDLLSTYSDLVEVEFTYAQELEENLGDYAGALIKTFREASAENKNIRLLLMDEDEC